MIRYYKTKDGDNFYKLEEDFQVYVFFPPNTWRPLTPVKHKPIIPEITRIINTKYGKIKYKGLLEAENKEW